MPPTHLTITITPTNISPSLTPTTPLIPTITHIHLIIHAPPLIPHKTARTAHARSLLSLRAKVLEFVDLVMDKCWSSKWKWRPDVLVSLGGRDDDDDGDNNNRSSLDVWRDTKRWADGLRRTFPPFKEKTTSSRRTTTGGEPPPTPTPTLQQQPQLPDLTLITQPLRFLRTTKKLQFTDTCVPDIQTPLNSIPCATLMWQEFEDVDRKLKEMLLAGKRRSSRNRNRNGRGRGAENVLLGGSAWAVGLMTVREREGCFERAVERSTR
ncbi:MAG: hypothetical protein M1834_002900 [Cirrosporium novae-zelandiae]|nr:MAG: hypothetical protein M1834_002900 [Cirrosporium novae-zelandiae]